MQALPTVGASPLAHCEQWQTQRKPLPTGNAYIGVEFRGGTLRRHRSTQVDFSSSYDINSHCNVCFEAFNLDDEMFNTHGKFKEQVLDVVDFGGRSTLGVDAKW